MRGQRNLFKPGDKFGKLEIKKVWSQPRKNNSKETVCECLCECGRLITVRTKDFKDGRKSCGCIREVKNKKHPAWKGYEDISASVWGKIKGGAKNRGRIIPFEITIEQCWELFEKQNRKCALTNETISFPLKDVKYGGICTASLDRIDSTKGYTLENIQWVHKIVNLMKMSLPQEEFVTWCRLIAEHNS